MAKATGFQVDLETGDIKMNAGDTGSFKVCCTRKSGNAWTSDSRMLYTIRSQNGEIMLQRIYRLDDQYDLGDGWILMEYHNDDTDDWSAQTYQTEIRVDVNPMWEGTPSDARCVDALAPGAARMIEGVPVRTLFRGTLRIDGVQGRI